jgi:F-type H+-transporting ATPase subunit gamma
MRRASVVQAESKQIDTVENLTGAFESIASTRVAKVKSKVELSKEFFDLLWQHYSALRVDPNSRITHRPRGQDNGKKVFVIISAESGLSGDIDQRLIETMMKNYDSSTTDIVVLGSHGANQLKQRGIPFNRFFQAPESDSYLDVSPVIEAIEPYAKVTIYYEEYVSLGVQGIKAIDLISSIQAMSRQANVDENLITAQDTVFEPSLDDIADTMETAMTTLAFSQAILESSLAQNASRFNAMAAAKERAWELLNYYKLEYHRSKRTESDRRSREVVVGLKKKKHSRRKR